MLALFVALVACASTPSDVDEPDAAEPFTCIEPTELTFNPDPGDADEANVCFAFDASGLTALGGVVWTATDPSSPTLLHHATLYAAPSDLPSGQVSCDGMPRGAVGLHVWSPGGDDLELPNDVALAIPRGTTQLVIEAHVLRNRDRLGDAGTASATLCAASPTAVHQAAFFAYSAPVPALRPMHDEESDGACELAHDAHVWSVWPHMHLAGAQITVQLRSTDGAARPLVDVSPWRFHQQATYRVSIDARAGDTIETHCRWRNDTDAYIFPGGRTQDEMCNTGLIVWPVEAASCR